MSVFFDLIILAVIVLSVYNGWRQGLVKSIMSFASAILAFFAAVFFTPMLGSFICDNFVAQPLSNEVSETLSSLLAVSKGDDAFSTAELFEEMPDPLVKILERYDIDTDDFVKRFSEKTPATEEIVSKMSDAIARPVAQTVSAAIAFIVIFVIVSVILKIVAVVIGLVFELPALKQLNEVFGLVFGVFSALFYAVVFANAFVHLSGALTAFDPSAFSSELIDRTYLVRFFSGFEISMLSDIMTSIRSMRS